MICPVCGNEIKAGNNFCQYCGTPVSQTTEQQQTPGIQQTQMNPAQQSQMNPAPQPAQEPPRKTQNSNKPLLIAIICLLALLIIGVFTLVIVLNKNNNNDKGTSVATDKDDDDDDDDDDDKDDDDEDDKDDKEEVAEVEDDDTDDAAVNDSSDSGSSNTGKKIAEKKEEPTTEVTHIYPDDAVAYNGHHYKVFYESKTWQDAEDYCVSLGGHLISINSSTEQDFAIELSSGNQSRYNVWTGGHLVENGVWEWTDGSSFSYSNWDIWYYNDDGSYVLKPDNYTGSEFVIRFPNRTVEFEDWTTYEGKWDDSMNDPDLGTETFCFICEWAE